MALCMVIDAEITAARLQRLFEDGFVVIPNALTPAQIAWARAAIDRLTPQHWDYTGLVDHYKCVFNREPGWLTYLDIPGVIELIEAALGADCHIIGQTAWRCHPGFIGAELHADYLPIELAEALLADSRMQLPMFICTTHFYLDDIDTELCPTAVIPGSHRAGRKPRPDETEWRDKTPQPILCAAGSALIFRSDVWHSGSRNVSAQTRYLLQVHYGRRMVAQKFSPYLHFQFNPEVLAAANVRQRRLLGEHEAAEYD